MSVINQMLLELERRHASSGERRGLVDFVRALPDSGSARVPRWLVAISAFLVVAVLILFAAKPWGMWRHTQATTLSAALAHEPLAAPAMQQPMSVGAVTPPPEPMAQAPRIALPAAARLSLEISTPRARVERAPAPHEAPIAAADPRPAEIAKDTPVPADSQRRLSGVISQAPILSAALLPPMSAVGKTEPHAQQSAEKLVKQVSGQQRAENEFRRGSALLYQGYAVEAQAAFEETLVQNPNHDGARQALLGVLLNLKRYADAERLLRAGLEPNPNHPGFAMALARLQLERGEVALALETLQRSLPFAQKSADYLAFVAALFARASRHAEAVEQYQAALRLSPSQNVWWMGMGMSLQAVNRLPEAQDAFARAAASKTLSPELAAFVDQRSKQINQQLRQ